jgi:hypothetical protein
VGNSALSTAALTPSFLPLAFGHSSVNGSLAYPGQSELFDAPQCESSWAFEECCFGQHMSVIQGTGVSVAVTPPIAQDRCRSRESPGVAQNLMPMAFSKGEYFDG